MKARRSGATSKRTRTQNERGGTPGMIFVATWKWLRIANTPISASALLSVLAGIVLISQLATGVAYAAASKEPRAINVADSSTVEDNRRSGVTSANETTVRPTEQQPEGRSDTGFPVLEAEKDRAAKNALDQRLVDFNGDLARYTGYLVALGALQFVAVVVQLVLLLFAFRESRRASDIAHNTMVAGQGAFVFAVNAAGVWEIDPKTQQYNWRLRALIRNTGNTPTRKLTMRSACLLLNHKLPVNFDFDNNMTAAVGSGLLGPKADGYAGIAPASPDPSLTPQDIIDVQNGRRWLYLMGWLRYYDVFPGTRRHLTRYCWLVTPAGNPNTFTPASPNSVTFPTLHHFEGNSTDEESDT